MMIKLTITMAAYEAIAATFAPGKPSGAPELTADGHCVIWVPQRTIQQLKAVRRRCEGFSDTIIRMARRELSP